VTFGQVITDDVYFPGQKPIMNQLGGAVDVLHEQESIDGSRIYIAGHSLGGGALPRIHSALTEENEVSGYIFLAAPARKMYDMMKEQYDFLYSLEPVLTKDQEAQKAEIYASLEKLKNAENLEDTQALLGAYGTYWKDLNAYDPVTTAKTMTKPCLVLQGEEDYQVTMEDFNLWKAAYGSKANWQFISYDGLTHLFMPGEKANGPADYQKKQQVDSRVVEDIVKFIE